MHGKIIKFWNYILTSNKRCFPDWRSFNEVSTCQEIYKEYIFNHCFPPAQRRVCCSYQEAIPVMISVVNSGTVCTLPFNNNIRQRAWSKFLWRRITPTRRANSPQLYIGYYWPRVRETSRLSCSTSDVPARLVVLFSLASEISFFPDNLYLSCLWCLAKRGAARLRVGHAAYLARLRAVSIFAPYTFEILSQSSLAAILQSRGVFCFHSSPGWESLSGYAARRK